VYTLNINRFDSSIEHGDLLDLSSCAVHTYDYTWIQMRFPVEPDVLQEIKYSHRQIQHETRLALALTAIRLPVLDVQFEASALYMTIKLLQDPAVVQYFDKTVRTTLATSTRRVPADNDHLCARQCFKMADCAAFAHCSSLECDLFLDPEFATAYDQRSNKLDYDASTRIGRQDDEQCNLFVRRVPLRSDSGSHLDNRRLIARWQRQVDDSQMILSLAPNLDEDRKVELIADLMAIDVRPGRLLDAQDDFEQSWADELDDERNVERYDQLFSVVRSSHMFDLASMKQAALKVRELSWLSLYECQVACANEPHCASYSYCGQYRKCVLTELFSLSYIDNHVKHDGKCMISTSKSSSTFFKKFELI
jgi:hypothetical protein